jgi:hypothetical protein
VPQTVLAAFKGHDAGGVIYVNTLAVQQDVPLGPDTALGYQTIADDIWAQYGATYLGMISPDYTVDELHVLGILGADGEGTHAVGSNGTLAVGGATGHSLPKEVCLVLSLKTGHAARSGRGRMFIPSPGYSSFGADRTSWLTAGVFWGGVLNFAALLPADHNVTHDAIIHRYRAGVWSRADNVFRECTAAVPRTAYHWLRSRSTAP